MSWLGSLAHAAPPPHPHLITSDLKSLVSRFRHVTHFVVFLNAVGCILKKKIFKNDSPFFFSYNKFGIRSQWERLGFSPVTVVVGAAFISMELL